MLPTVAEVLALEAVRRGQPRVVAGAHRLDTPVRWVHAIEFADAARLLRGGELVLATGIVLPDEGALLDAYVADLATVGVSRARRRTWPPPPAGCPAGSPPAAQAHRAAADRRLGREVLPRRDHYRGVRIARIIDDQLDQLRASARLHEVSHRPRRGGRGPWGDPPAQAALLAGLAGDPGGPVASRARARRPRGPTPRRCWTASRHGRAPWSWPSGPVTTSRPAGWSSTAGRPGEDPGPGHPGLRRSLGPPATWYWP